MVSHSLLFTFDLLSHSYSYSNNFVELSVYSFNSTFSSLFINDSGVARVSSTGESEIYIDCQPTDISKESEEVVIKKPNISFDINTDWANNEYVFLILIIIGFGLFIYVMYKLLHYFTENADKGLEYLQGAM